MENNSKAWLIGGLIDLPIIGIGYYQYIINNYDYSIANIQVNSVSSDSADIVITLEISSKIGISFTVSDIYFDIYMEGFKVGNVYQQTPLQVPNFGKGQLQVLATIDLSSLRNQLGNIIYDTITGKTYNVSLVGYSHVRVGQLPFTTNVALKFGYSLAI